MKKRTLAALLGAALLLLNGCTRGEAGGEGERHILCTTYPVYLFTTAVTEGVEGLEVSLLVNQPTACLHDYTLTVPDMRAIEKAELIVMNGVGLEEFMDAALEQSDAGRVDASAGIELFPAEGHEGHDGHDHEEEYDPHIWMDPERAAQMVENIAAGLGEWDPDHEEAYQKNASAAVEMLAPLRERARELQTESAARWREKAAFYLEHPETNYVPWEYEYDPKLITFHDGFRYFAAAFQLHLVKSIEEEEGATASAREIREIVELMGEYEIPAIFVEENGATATARAIARETGCGVYTLSMLMSGTGEGMEPYVTAMETNLETILEALQ